MTELCSKYGLSINMSKINVMIFRNDGQLRTNEMVYIDNEPLVETRYQKYLGIWFSSRIYWPSTLTFLSSQADKAIYTNKFITCECNGFPVQILSLYYYSAARFGHTLFEVKMKRFTESFVNMLYVFPLKYLQRHCLKIAGDSRCQFIICLDV